jgi:hypothetical protein
VSQGNGVLLPIRWVSIVGPSNRLSPRNRHPIRGGYGGYGGFVAVSKYDVQQNYLKHVI